MQGQGTPVPFYYSHSDSNLTGKNTQFNNMAIKLG